MIGARAHGENKVYRYYTCFNRAHYDTTKRDATRINADAVEPAVLDALASFHPDSDGLIAEAVTRAQAQHLAGEDNQRAELETIEAACARPTSPSTGTSTRSRTASSMRTTSPHASPGSRSLPQSASSRSSASPNHRRPRPP
ncbi:zinc ribbon domain-containing protein [Amycolatopsis japonica]|uniref:zinc ribbon domain-containing protein n=1 Tax=Amycolatopsis japonica TaxID=208439 RepID=UPI0037F1FE18